MSIPSDTEDFKRFAEKLIDNALSHTLIVSGDSRKFLQGMKAYLPSMPETEVQRLIDMIPK